MAALGIAYLSQASGVSYNLVFDFFTGNELARTYEQSATFSRGVSGQQLITGRPGRQKNIWALSVFVSAVEAKTLDDMFKAWDLDRGDGKAAAVGITDETLFDPLSTSAVFSTPPSFIRTGPNNYTAAFGLTEV